MDKVKKVKKHSYLLLELLVAFFLLSLFLAPMLSSPFAYVRKQMRDMTKVYLQLEEEKLLAVIEERLRSGSISWETLMASEKKPVLLETRALKFPGDEYEYEAKLFLAKAEFQNREDLSFGTVKAGVKIYKLAQKKPLKKAASLSLFILKKQTIEPHAPT